MDNEIQSFANPICIRPTKAYTYNFCNYNLQIIYVIYNLQLQFMAAQKAMTVINGPVKDTGLISCYWFTATYQKSLLRIIIQLSGQMDLMC